MVSKIIPNLTGSVLHPGNLSRAQAQISNFIPASPFLNLHNHHNINSAHVIASPTSLTPQYNGILYLQPPHTQCTPYDPMAPSHLGIADDSLHAHQNAKREGQDLRDKDCDRRYCGEGKHLSSTIHGRGWTQDFRLETWIWDLENLLGAAAGCIPPSIEHVELAGHRHSSFCMKSQGAKRRATALSPNVTHNKKNLPPSRPDLQDQYSICAEDGNACSFTDTHTRQGHKSSARILSRGTHFKAHFYAPFCMGRISSAGRPTCEGCIAARNEPAKDIASDLLRDQRACCVWQGRSLPNRWTARQLDSWGRLF